MTSKNTWIGIIVIIVLIVVILIAAALLGHVTQAPATVPVADNSNVLNSTPTNSVSYSCDGGKVIAASFYDGTTTTSASADEPPTPSGSMVLTLGDGSAYVLNQTVSADGGRYANKDESLVFWDKGNTALVQENGAEKNYTNCKLITK